MCVMQSQILNLRNVIYATQLLKTLTKSMKFCKKKCLMKFKNTDSPHYVPGLDVSSVVCMYHIN